MTIYVQSRGKSQDHDHCWLAIRKDAQPPEMPSVLKEIKPEELIDSQKPSMILARSGKYLVLLVMSLKAGDERLDFMGRQIYNSVAWVEIESTEKERQLREIAIQAIKGDLADIVSDVVKNDADSPYGFRVDFGDLKKIGDLSHNGEIGSKEADLKRLVGKDNELLRSALVKELTEYSLPTLSEGIQILVMVTTIKSLEGLKRKGVWRGLSSRIESEEWKEIDVPEIKEAEATKPEKKFLGAIALIIVGVVAIVAWFVINHQIPRDVQPKSTAPGQSNVMKAAAQKSPETFQK